MHKHRERKPFTFHHYWHVVGLTDLDKIIDQARFGSIEQPDVHHRVHKHGSGHKCSATTGCLTFVLGQIEADDPDVSIPEPRLS